MLFQCILFKVFVDALCLSYAGELGMPCAVSGGGFGGLELGGLPIGRN